MAHCVSSDFGRAKGLASAVACSYTELQQVRKLSFTLFSPGAFVTYFDQQHQRFSYNLLTKKQFFQKPTYEALEPNLQALKQHLTRQKIPERAIPKLGCGYDQLHWPTFFPILFKFFRVQTLL